MTELPQQSLTVITCGAPLARRLDDLRSELLRRWPAELLRFISTDAAGQWLNHDPTQWRSYQQPKPPRPTLVIVFPVTFNTANKVAAGIADTPAAAALCEATAARTPVIAVPMLNDTLARHPAWQHSTELLTGCGWRWIPLDGTPEIQTSPKPISSGVGEQLADAFRVDQLADLIVSEPVL